MAIGNHDLVGHFGVVDGLIQAKMEHLEDPGFLETKTVDHINEFAWRLKSTKSLTDALGHESR